MMVIMPLLIFNYNLFNGMADSAAKQANQHRLLNQKYTLSDSKRFIRANTEIAWRTFISTKKQLVYINQNIKATDKTVKAYQKEHNLGRRSIIDLLNIELEYNNAQNAKITDIYDHLVAYYKILSYTGTLLEGLDVDTK